MPDDPFPSPEAIEAALLVYNCGSTRRHPDERVNEAVKGYVVDIIAAAVKVQPVVSLPPCPTCVGMGGRITTSDGDLDRGAPIARDRCPSCKGSGVDRLIPESEIREWIIQRAESGMAQVHDLGTFGRWLDEREARQ